MINILIFVLASSGCINSGNNKQFDSETYNNVSDAVSNYFADKSVAGSTQSSNFQGRVGIGKISDTEAYVSVEKDGHKWEGTWKYDGTKWNPGSDFKMVS